jgi:organic hydroperoxide reductase OsmC/OhrA
VPSHAVVAGGDQGMSAPRGIPRTPIRAAGRPSVSRTRPSTKPGGFAPMRREAAVGFGAVAQPAARTAAMVQPTLGTMRIAANSMWHDLPMAENDEIHRFDAVASWSGDGAGAGEVRVSEGRFGIPIAGAKVLGGSGGKANSEELLLAAVATCFVNTWAIFIKKLGLPVTEPSIAVSGELGPDPAGGFRMLRAVIHARVPAALLAADRPKVEKSLQLAEKYCIISKVARAAMPLAVEIDEA